MGSPQDVFLRTLQSGDAGDVLAAFQSDPDMVRQGSVATTDEAEEYVAHLVAPDSPHRPWAVVQDSRVVGLVCVSVDLENRNGWFWYWAHADTRGRGIMSRAAATVADWALTEGALERLELGHRANNPASGRVAAAAGFIREGTEREKFLVAGQRIDVYTYSRLRSDPFPEQVAIELRRPM